MTKYLSENRVLFPASKDAVINIRSIHCSDKGNVMNRMFYRKGRDLDAFWEAIETYAQRQNDSDYNIYINLHVIKPTFTGPQANKEAIARRDLLLIDIDRTGSPKVPSTENELQAAIVIGGLIASFLKERGWPDPIRTISGNGCHLYYFLEDLTADDSDGEFVKTFLKCLAAKFNTPEIEIDTVVHDAARITKFLGTVMRKGPQTKDRPYRVARILKDDSNA
tara:strand:- start:233 stop:898 length:666 start_codon:yes stop_codon:yes gene_type:complete